MKLAIIGAQCTGKSTLINAFLQKHPDWSAPQARSYREFMTSSGHPINDKATINSQMLGLYYLEERDALVGSALGNIISDRCAIDSFIYTIPVIAKQGSRVDYFCVRSRAEASVYNNYDAMIYIAASDAIPLADDGVRSVDPDFRKLMDTLYMDYMYNSTYVRWASDYDPSKQPPIYPIGVDVVDLDDRVAQVEVIVESVAGSARYKARNKIQ